MVGPQTYFRSNSTEASIPILPFEGLVRIDTILAHYQVSKAQLYQEISEGKFPEQIKIGRSSFWDAKKFREFLKRRGADVHVPTGSGESQ